MKKRASKYNISLTKEDAQMIDEMSSISGYTVNAVKEILTFLAVYYVLKICENPDKMNQLRIPFLGWLAVKYKGDREREDKSLETLVDCFFAPSDEFKTSVGNIHDDAREVADEILREMINDYIPCSSTIK